MKRIFYILCLCSEIGFVACTPPSSPSSPSSSSGHEVNEPSNPPEGSVKASSERTPANPSVSSTQGAHSAHVREEKKSDSLKNEEEPSDLTIPLYLSEEDASKVELKMIAKELEAGEPENLTKALNLLDLMKKKEPQHPGVMLGYLKYERATLSLPESYGCCGGNKSLLKINKKLETLSLKEPSFAALLLERGFVYLMLGDAEKALPLLKEAARLLPKHPEPYAEIAVAEFALGHVDSALTNMQESVKLEPSSGLRHETYASMLLIAGKVREAVLENEKAVELLPRRAQSHANLGTSYLTLGEIDKGIAELRKALSIEPKRPGFHSNLGYALQLKGHVSEARKEYEEAISIDSKQIHAWINLATLLAKDPSTRAGARKALLKAKQIDASDPRIEQNLQELDALERGH